MGAFGSVGVLTQLWCARVPAVAALVGCFTLALHGTRRPRTAVQSRVGVGVALFAPCRVARRCCHGPAFGVTVRPWWPDVTPLYVVRGSRAPCGLCMPHPQLFSVRSTPRSSVTRAP